MKFKTADWVYPSHKHSVSITWGSQPFPTVGLDVNDRVIIMLLLNHRTMTLVVKLMGKVFHL